jgi:hypothetical protein
VHKLKANYLGSEEGFVHPIACVQYGKLKQTDAAAEVISWLGYQSGWFR